MRKTLKTFSLYGSSSSAAQDFQSRLYKVFTQTLERLGPISLRIDSSSLIYHGETVLSEDSSVESYLYRLYSTGIRYLTFRPGLNIEELSEFLHILSLDPNTRELQDDDLVTLFWKSDFNNIHYIVVEGFTEAGNKQEDQENVDFEAALSSILDAVENELPPEQIVHSVRISEEDINSSPPAIQLEQFGPSKDKDSNAKVFLLTDQEMLEIQTRILSKPPEYDLAKVTDMLIELMAWESDSTEVQNILDSLLLILDYALSRDMFEIASRVVGGIKWITIPRKDGHTYSEAAIQAAHSGLLEASLPERIKPLLSALSDEKNHSRITAHLRALPQQAAEVLSDLLVEVPERVHRDIISSVIVRLGRNNPQIFVSRLEHSKWFVVQAMVNILGQIGQHEHLPAILKVYEHENPEVRAEVVDATAKFTLEEVKYFLSKALFDEDKRVRIKAITQMSRFKGSDTAKYLLGQVKDTSFLDKNRQEQRAWFKTISEVGDESIIPELEELVTARKFRKRSQYEHIRAGSLYAISRIGGPAAAKALEKLSKARLSGLIRAAHSRALEELKKKK
ncbi:MAG: HEAT repeat domain-containing protein [Deltaproteobacteria bacterium]|nr:HEAT repeat domain-containing protein [Deltaproteobacteria bacterium]